MDLLKFFYSRILKREYPLITTKGNTFDGPYFGNLPDTVHIIISKKTMENFRLDKEDFVKFTIHALEHEHIHLTLNNLIKDLGLTSRKLDNLHKWSIPSKQRMFLCNDQYILY